MPIIMDDQGRTPFDIVLGVKDSFRNVPLFLDAKEYHKTKVLKEKSDDKKVL